MRKRTTMVLAVLGLMTAALIVSAAATASASLITPSLSGGATVTPSGVSLTSDLTDSNAANDSSAITFTLPAGTTFADLTSLGTNFDPLAGSPASGSSTPLGCGGGSPRFAITLASGKNVFVYLGPSPDFNSCALNASQSSGNLIGNQDTGRYDTSQVQAGTQSNTYNGALALVGSQQVTSISLVVDAGWAFTPKVQTVLVSDVEINGMTFYGPTAPPHTNPAGACKAERAALGVSAFDQKYGTNHNLRNALGKCISGMAHQRFNAAGHSTQSHHGHNLGGDDH